MTLIFDIYGRVHAHMYINMHSGSDYVMKDFSLKMKFYCLNICTPITCYAVYINTTRAHRAMVAERDTAMAAQAAVSRMKDAVG